jgi:glycosyltransferase involved in cell wall biosynthesis
MYFPPSLGGGERYLLTAAEALRELGDVDFVCRQPVDLAPLAAHFGLDLSGVRAVEHRQRSLHGLRDWIAPRRYDLFIALDNHLAPVQVSLGKRGVLQLQAPPYPAPKGRRWRGMLRLKSYDVVICYSEYTRVWAERHGTAGLPVQVIYPPVETNLYRPLTKHRSILSVGRFFVGRHQKQHPVMIEAFRECIARGLRGWRLHLAGSVRRNLPDDVEYLEALRRQAEGLPVEFHVSAPLEEMRRLYGEASVYWHATGYGVDAERNPQFLEHFGMSVVEAMSAGAVPVVIGRGGPLEILREGESGFFWNEPEELVTRTLEVVAGKHEAIRARAEEAAQRFTKARFGEQVRALAHQLVS